MANIGQFTNRGRNMNTIMNSEEVSYGPVIMSYYGLYVEIPQNCININGLPRKNISRRLKEGFTKKNIAYFQSKGMKIFLD